ncbi:hypothetical protein C8J55DRAFT_558547 [Lentinula edodes]|uniref:Uncharacterized protein n=1 Tax=Lentinula lateritia TaxID=40482 RepID=A0A9W9AR13_9AGAR|nr:hypothetical protein C8J55DRAFT_558547 [Lentinula edodes]
MASSASSTRTGASSTLLPASLAEAQKLIAGLKLKSSQPLFFESDSFQRLSEGDYSPPILDSQNSPDHDSSRPFPAFSYPSALVPFCFPPGSSRHLSVASGLDLFCSASMITQILYPLLEASDSLDSGEAFNAFEEAAPFLIYVHDFWIGRANCPLFAEHVLRTADGLFQRLPAFLRDSLEQQWGIPFNHQSSFLGPSDFKQFPVIPIPFYPFVSLRSSMTETCLLPGGPRIPSPVEDSFESSEENQSVAPPKRNKRKRELTSLMADASTILDRRSNIKSPLKEDRPVLPKASSSKKKVEKPVPKSKVTARSKTTVKVVEESRAAKGKARQMEVLDVKESDTEEEVVPPPSKRLKSSKSAPAPLKASNFRPALLIDEQGRLKLPGDSVEGFTPFKRIEHARNSAPLQRQNPIFDVNPEFLDLGVILTTQKASFTMQDLLQINRSIRDPSIPAQACVSALSRGEFNPNASRLPGLKYVDLAMDALNALHVATTSSTLNLTNSLRRTQELRTQLDRLGALFDQARQSFLRSFLDLQQAGQDPIVVLEALKAAEPQRESISVEDWTLLATLFQWSSPFNLNGLKFDNRTPAEWIDLLRSIHSGATSATVTTDGHLVDTSQPPEAAVEVSETLDPQDSLPNTVVEKASGVEDLASLSEGTPIQTELDLPQIESLTESTLAPEKGI